MSLLNLFILSIFLLSVESFKGLNKKLTPIQNILCTTDSDTIHFLTIDKETFDYIDELIEPFNRDCSFKTIQVSAMNMIQPLVQYHSKVTVFMVNSRKSIPYFLQAATRYKGSNSSQRFLVLFYFQYDLGVLVNTFKKLAEKTVFKIVVIIHDGLDEFLFTYSPLDGTFNSFDDSGITGEVKIEDKFVRNRSELRGRSLIVSMYEQNDRAVVKRNGRPGYDGVDGLIADLLEERMNVTFVYTTPHEMYNGNKTSGVIGDLTSDGNADMSFNADSLALFLVNETVDYTVPFERNDMCILVPKAGNEAIIYNLLRTLSRTTWVVALFSLFVMMLIYRWTQGVQKLILSRKYSFYEYSWTEVSSMVFQSFFGDSITRIPTSQPLRILIIVWCVYSFLITNAFQAKLISSLVRPRGLNDIETIEQLGHSNLKIMYPKALANHIKEYTNSHVNVLKNQLVEVESWSEFDAAICNKNVTAAFILMRFHADLMEKRNFDKAAGLPTYTTMKECLLSFPRVYFLKLGSIYVDYLSELIRRFHEMGFIDKWARYSDFVSALHGNVVVEENENDEVDESNIKVVITTDHLQTAFYLLFVGLVAASLAFVGEKTYFRSKKIKLSSM